MKWILCDERLPDDNREVLISLEWGIDIGTYERGEWRSEWINHYDDDNVLAWMPLPKPYKADRKTEPKTCDNCKLKGSTKWCNNQVVCRAYKIKDEPQTTMDCSKCEKYKDGGELCDFCAIKDEPQTDCLTCRYNSDEWDSPKCDGCSKAHSNYEPQTDCAWK